MRADKSVGWLRILIPGVILFQLGGCLGPNPGFFISTAAAGATISTLVNLFLTQVLGLGGA